MEEEAWQGGTSDCTAGELAQLLYWCERRMGVWGNMGKPQLVHVGLVWWCRLARFAWAQLQGRVCIGML
jgi:hypothetical protein